MTDRPIIFSAPMVRALLDGRKSQTRRILKPRPLPVGGPFYRPFPVASPREWHSVSKDGYTVNIQKVPYAVGDRLWVREAHAFMPKTAYALPKAINPADPDMAAYYREGFDRSGKIIWRPSIHMPRWASRITLDVTEVRVQRLQEISEDDAKAEGAEQEAAYTGRHDEAGNPEECGSYRLGFSMLWNSLHGPGAWEANPWVAAISFKRIT